MKICTKCVITYIKLVRGPSIVFYGFMTILRRLLVQSKKKFYMAPLGNIVWISAVFLRHPSNIWNHWICFYSIKINEIRIFSYFFLKNSEIRMQISWAYDFFGIHHYYSFFEQSLNNKWLVLASDLFFRFCATLNGLAGNWHLANKESISLPTVQVFAAYR